MDRTPSQPSSQRAEGSRQTSGRTTSSLTGAGVKIGVIDLGFEGFAALMGTELPSTVVARCYTSIGVFTSNIADCENGEVHGTAVAEAIIDMAPQASLYIANSVSSADSVAIATWMTGQGVTVINRSLGSIWQGPGDGTSPFSDSVFTMIDAAVSGGALFANSAGNSGRTTWYGAYSDTDGDDFHNFLGTDETNNVSLVAGEQLFLELRWDDSWDAATRDLDLELYDSSLERVAISFNFQDGVSGRTPYERIIYTAPTTGVYGVVVSRFSGALPSWIQIRKRGVAEFDYVTPARSITPAAESFNPGLLAVGAAPWFDNDTIETFSSQGPTIDGRTKPDIVGVDQGDSATYGPGGFFGTSQASPHVAGLAALVKQNFSSMTPAQIATYLKDNALPRGTSPNNTWGYGLAQLPAIVPGAPTSIAATPGNGQATVTWNAPATGGSPITGYTVTPSPGGTTTAVGGSTLTAVLTGLANGTPHTFTVTATNAVGTSDVSAPSDAVTPNDPPELTVSPNTTGDEGALLTLQLASFTDSDVADTHTASVDWGDGTTSTAAVVESGGSGTVTDSFGGASSDSFTIVVDNVTPSVFAESTLITAGSTSITPSVHYSDVGILDAHSAEIDWGDGATSTAVIDAARRFVKGGHTYSSTGQFTVTVTVTDNAGDSGSDTLTVDVTSAPVAVSIPSLSTWGLVAMALALVAVFAVRRRSFDRLRMSGD